MEPLVWLFVIVGAVVAAQSAIDYAIVVVGVYFFVGFLVMLYVRYKCQSCLATFTFNDLRGK